MTVAFVLSGGASLGAAQAGMLHALYEREIRADLLVGASAGAINAAFLASRPQSVDTAHQLQVIWRGIGRADVFPASPLTAWLGVLGMRDHTVPSGALRSLIGRHLEIERLQDGRQLGAGDRAADQPALDAVAPHGGQRGELAGALHALGDDVHAEGPPQRDQVVRGLPNLGMGAVQASADRVGRVPRSQDTNVISPGDELLRQRLDMPVYASLISPGIGRHKRNAHCARVPTRMAILQ